MPGLVALLMDAPCQSAISIGCSRMPVLTNDVCPTHGNLCWRFLMQEMPMFTGMDFQEHCQEWPDSELIF